MSLMIVLLYLMVVFAGLAAWFSARTEARPRSHSVHWMVIAGAFTGLVLIRLVGLEEAARQWLRGLIEREGLYADRSELQAPLAGIAICASAALVVYAIRAWPGPRSRSAVLIWVSRMAVLGFVPLFGLRLVSLHATDQLLYAGPLRLNWVIDGALTLASLGAAILYVANLRQRARDPRAQRAGRELSDRR